MNKLYLKHGAYFDVQKGTAEQLEIFLQALRDYGCTNVPSEPTGTMLSSNYIVYAAAGWPRSNRMVLSSGGGRNAHFMQYEVVLPDTPKEPKPAMLSTKARLKIMMVTMQTLIDDLEKEQ